MGMTEVLKALSKLRINPVMDEYELQNKIAVVLAAEGISFVREYKLGPRSRVDFLTGDGIAIEVKKGKPNKSQVINQLEKYAAFDDVSEIILVVEKNLDIPREINGKPCISFGLNKLWGIAL
jgi:hypothetical protein